MAGPGEPTPSVKFTLDDSEMTRLEQLRAHLKLAHWVRIGDEFELKPDDTVAKTINALKTQDPVAYDKQHAPWQNRYSDLKMSWVKKRDDKTNEIQGHLMASGNLRIKNLGEIGQGCSVSLMHGLMLNDPLPTTKVGNLRINHILLEIIFRTPLQLDGNRTEETNYKVGNKNHLFGAQLRNENAKKFKQAQAVKKGAVTKRMLTSLLKTMSDMNVDGKTSGDGDEEISDLEEDGDDKLQLGETPSLFRNDSNSWSNSNSGRAQPSFNQSYRPTQEQSEMKSLVRNLVGTTNDGSDVSQTEGGQPLGEAASLSNSKVVPNEAAQVRFENFI